MNRKNQALTLIELLVVLAIISIFLVAIILPVSSRISQSAKSAQCVAKLREIGSALALYSAENNGYLPPGYGTYISSTTAAGRKGTYSIGLELYGVPPARLNCPATSVNGQGIYRKFWPDWFSDYTFNHNVFVNSGVFKIRKRLEFPAATTIAAYDGLGRLASRPASNPESVNVNGFFQSSQAAPRHGGYVNVLFLDGHIEAMKEMPVDAALWGSGPVVW